MNYKVLVVSAVVGVGVIAGSLWQAQTPGPGRKVERMTAVDIEEPENQFGFSEAMSSSAYPAPMVRDEPRSPEPPPERAAAIEPLSLPPADIPVGLPQIAYVYSYGFRLAGESIPKLQQRHADLCESKGPLVCRIISMDQTTEEGRYTGGTLQLAVASIAARSFGKQLATLAEGEDGTQIKAAISGEDLSKRIVDTEARLRTRVVLRDRLMEVLATRRGTVTELVEAERGVAQVNEEIDQARSWLSEMKGRVAFSRLDIAYESDLAAPAPAQGSGFMEPVRGSVGRIGTILGSIVGVLITLAAIFGPFGLIGYGAMRWWRRFGPAKPVEA
jgi:hypothetical protein